MTNGRRRELFLALGPAFCLAACSPTGPPPAVYVLGTPTPAKTNVEVLAGQPVLEVKPVTVPDYLDISDILTRRGDNSMTPSPTGRWGERLSLA
ncbi:MAG: membrane integrity-associated transporter subunit PqiC [Acetobacteraceae bacterium]|nr:membrane integrity-associated transporter subunit PqiC [Acetobacteraceae bacterium]